MFKAVMCQVRQQQRFRSTYVRYDEFISFRRNQAEKSMLIQVSGKGSCQDLQSHLVVNFGQLSAIYHYSIPKSQRVAGGPALSQAHWVIAEFADGNILEKALDACKYSEDAIPFRSQLCSFSPKKSRSSKQRKTTVSSDDSIISENLGQRRSSTNVDYPVTLSLSEQMERLHSEMQVTEIGMRLRFLIVQHLEKSLKGFFPAGCILPFGSSVCGIGSNSGDLDLVLLRDQSEFFPLKDTNQDSPLCFIPTMGSVGGASGARAQNQKALQTVAELLSTFCPGYSEVNRILAARVPILRFNSDYAGMQCDLSMSSSSGVFMSELIYMMGCIDHRFQPLVVSIRAWAAARKITNPHPGPFPTNFFFVLLVINFLQHKSILPTWDVLFNHAGKEDHRVTSDEVECTFLRDMHQLNRYFTPRNPDLSLSALLYEFFEFYSNFDFTTKGISLFTGGSSSKPSASALYIQNPLERHRNVSMNVSKEQVVRLQNEFRSTVWKFESLASSSERSVTLMDLYSSTESKHSKPGRRVSVAEIFKD